MLQESRLCGEEGKVLTSVSQRLEPGPGAHIPEGPGCSVGGQVACQDRVRNRSFTTSPASEVLFREPREAERVL